MQPSTVLQCNVSFNVDNKLVGYTLMNTPRLVHGLSFSLTLRCSGSSLFLTVDQRRPIYETRANLFRIAKRFDIYLE